MVVKAHTSLRPAALCVGAASIIAACSAGPPTPTPPDEPTIAVGWDAYRAWNEWPSLRVGVRAYMRATNDRSGGNEGSDASHYVRLTSDRAIAMDVRGPGVLYFARANRWHGSPWHYDIDGVDLSITETNTVSPDAPASTSVFVPSSLAPPINLTFATTQGGDLLATPMPFTSSLQIGHERTHYGAGYFIYDAFPVGATNLSQPIATFSEADVPNDVVDLVNQSGTDIAPVANATPYAGTVALASNASATILDAVGPSTLRALAFTVPLADAEAFGAARLRVTWDGRSSPSIDVPIALFFGAGSLLNRDAVEYLVKAFPVSIRFHDGAVTFATYFPMPFSRTAHVEIESATPIASVTWTARTLPNTDPANWSGYLHASYVDQGTPIAGEDLIVLDTTIVEGGGDWCGDFVGTSFTFSDQANLTTLEGDPRFFFDDSQTPQAQGTGTEEWGGGGDYWNGGQNTTLPFYGHPVGATDATSAINAEDEIESAYRFLLADAMPFGKNARIQLEHGGLDDSTEHYRTIAYWYGLPGACLVQTDSFHVSDAADEAAHAYVSPDASSVDTITGRYEWGVDHVGTTEMYPATTDTGRHTTGTSELTLAIDPDNRGVLLRRKLDLSFPDQAAEVWIAGDDSTAFALAGTWFSEGSNTCVYSNPPGETDAFSPALETTDHRFRDEEFLVDRGLTEGHSKLRLRVVFTPTNAPLTPTTPNAPQAWSELRYAAYVWRLPSPP